MTPEQHAARALRIEGQMALLADEDYEAVIEAAMLAGTHWLNVALHRFGLTADGDDVMHAEYLTGALRLKVRLVAPGLVERLDFIEASRPGYVRGNAPGGLAVAHRCRTELGHLRQLAERAEPWHGAYGG